MHCNTWYVVLNSGVKTLTYSAMTAAASQWVINCNTYGICECGATKHYADSIQRRCHNCNCGKRVTVRWCDVVKEFGLSRLTASKLYLTDNWIQVTSRGTHRRFIKSALSLRVYIVWSFYTVCCFTVHLENIFGNIWIVLHLENTSYFADYFIAYTYMRVCEYILEIS